MSCRRPGRTSTAPGTPSAGARVASDPSAAHAKLTNVHPVAVRSIIRVSTRRPWANSFQKRVPTGNSHAVGSEASMDVPGGSRSQRRFWAPSDHSGYCGT